MNSTKRTVKIRRIESSIVKYREKYEAMKKVEQKLIAATKEAWPIGMQVTSYKFWRGPIRCTVVGHAEYHDAGAIIVRNNRTLKTHLTWPFQEFSNAHGETHWGAEPYFEE